MKKILNHCLVMLAVTLGLAANAQVPVLSSHPTATATIFLDFDGHLVTGTSWNIHGPLECAGSGMDNTKIIEVFNRVAEDYRPFNINVTTDSTRFLAAPINRRMRVILTTTSSWYGSAGGVAFLNTFRSSDDTPCFVFSGLLGYNTKNVSEAAAHEAGHTLGMYHQSNYDANCVKVSDYHTGAGAGEIGWAPIMGVGYYKNFTLWNNGPNSMSCTNFQSDLDVITSVANGITYRTDDHQNSEDGSTLAPFDNSQFNLNGIIERSTDQDYFRFIIPATGRFELDATPYNVGTGNAGSNLDMQVTLLNEAREIINVYNPGTLLSSVVDSILDGGVYYIKIEGRGNLYAPSYASLGSYALQGKYTSTGVVLPLHKLELNGALIGDRHRLSWEIIADEQITSLVIEASTDGRNFGPLTATSTSATDYQYRPDHSGTVQYRLNVTFDNGRRYYSNVITLKNNSQAHPQVTGNIITTGTITVTSPGNFTYQLYDMNGRILSKGQLTNGTNMIQAGNLLNGMYMIRFAGNDQQWTEKLIKP